jgi:hypothetical protein
MISLTILTGKRAESFDLAAGATMPTSGAESHKQPRKYRLERILWNLRHNRKQSRQADDQAEQEFGTFTAAWSEARNEIAQRLAQVEAELARLAAQRPASPQLSLVTDAESTSFEGITSMGPY